MDKFIYVFNEKDKNTLLSRGYVLIQEPKAKQAPKKKTKGKSENTSSKAKSEDAEDAVEVEVIEEPKTEVKYWVFLNKSARDVVFSRLSSYAFSDTLSL